MMGNEGKYHRSEANIYLIECRRGDESDGCSGLERGRSHKAEESIVKQSGCIHIQFGEIQKNEKEYVCFDIKKREGCGCARFQSPLEVAVMAMERMEKKGGTVVARGEVSGNL
jgi:hypothetical protein